MSIKSKEPSANNVGDTVVNSSLCDGELEYDAEEDAEGDDAEDDPDHYEVAGAAVKAAVAIWKKGGKLWPEFLQLVDFDRFGPQVIAVGKQEL